jgi:sulfatase modifying factor 1
MASSTGVKVRNPDPVRGLEITKDTRGPNKPATNISWKEAARFVNWLNTSTGGFAAYKFNHGAIN